MKAKTAISGSLSNKGALTDAEINAGFSFNTILESPDLNGQLFDIDNQVDIISKEICNFLTSHSVTPVGSDNTQLGTLIDTMIGGKQDKLTAGQNITIDANNVISTTGASALNFPLFATMWLYSKPFNSSWVNANNYSWLYASMYVSAYNFLVSQLHPTGTAEQGSTYYVLRFDNGEGETTNVLVGSGTLSDLQTYCTAQGYTYNAAGTIEEFECYKTLSTSSETIEGVTITYYATYNGMKIITDAAEITNEETLYNLIGVDNYFILDEANNRFKLPRTKYGFTGLRDSVGKYVPETLPNIKASSPLEAISTHWVSSDLTTFQNSFTGALYATNINSNGGATYTNGKISSGFSIDASLSSSTYQNNAPVQQRATQMYLYFYLGNTGEIVDHQIASIALELFNNKADLDLNNVNSTGKTNVINWGIPDYDSVISVPFTTSWDMTGQTYTAPKAGEFYLSNLSSHNTDTLELLVNDNFVCKTGDGSSTPSWKVLSCRVKAGDVIKVRAENSAAVHTAVSVIAKFFPFIGA